jgi:general secretion pathway protein G
MSINQQLWAIIRISASPKIGDKLTRKHILSVTRGFTLLELIVVISIVAVMATAALDRLFWYQGQAEKTAMEYTATTIKSGLWMTAASLMMAEHTTDIPALTMRNPIDLLAQKPENYLGELPNVKTELLEGGNWVYDKATHQIIYIVRQRRYFKPETAGDYSVRYGMKVLYGEIALTPTNKASYIAGVTLIPLSKYTWH